MKRDSGKALNEAIPGLYRIAVRRLRSLHGQLMAPTSVQLLLLCLIGLCGCGTGTPEVREETHAPEKADVVADVLRSPSVATASALLAHNNIAEMLVSVPDGTADSILKGAETLVSGSAMVEVDDKSLFVMTAQVKPPGDNGGDDSISAKAAYVFTADGNFVHKLGGGRSSTLAGGDNVVITSLATSHSWFAIVTTPESKDGFEFLSSVYRINDPVTKAMTFRHSEGVTLPAFAETDDADSGRITFLTTNKGLGEDGREHSCSFHWDKKTQSFSGPSSITTEEDVKIFSVDLNNSPSFARSDSD